MNALTAFIERGNVANLANCGYSMPEEGRLVAGLAKVATPPNRATPEQETAIRAELRRIMGDHRDGPEALALALADPETALGTFRLTTSQYVPETIADDLDELRRLATAYHDARGDFIPDGAVELERLRRIALATVGRELAAYRQLVAQVQR